MSIQGLRLLAAVSGMIAVAVGAILAAKAPCLLVEQITESSYSIGPIAPFPILPALIVTVGVFSLASALRGRRFLSSLNAVCLGFLITSLTFTILSGPSLRVDKFGYPFGWLAWMHPPLGTPYIMGVIALPFLLDLAFWSLIVGAIVFAVRRLWSYLSGRRGMEKKMHVHLKAVEAAWLLAWVAVGGNPYWLIPAVFMWVLLKRWVYG